MKIENGQAYSFKLTSGQELVANVVDQDDEFFHLEQPLTIGQSQQGGMEFLPAMFTAVPLDSAGLHRAAVAIIAPVREDVLEAYKTSIDPSEILTPDTKQIITG